jgi:peptidoglycan/LPS O-acetylase OafA/YrhL
MHHGLAAACAAWRGFRMDYRREIDGLRALAVVPVILFHAGFETFSGGYVGVDVFFVISGYLITSIVLRSLDEGRFSVVEFYERRMRRILPALFLVLLVSLPFAWAWMLPADMKRYSESLASVALFASNILFWRTSGYFDTASELKPLLHTWSLAVEEQFYLLYPLLLALVWARGRRALVLILGTGAVISFALAEWDSVLSSSFTFYLLPTRAWELALGALTAIYLWRRPLPAGGPQLHAVASLLGLVLISFAAVAFDDGTPFPGRYALVPTLGTVLIICFASDRTWTGRLLGSRLLVGIGLMSYSAYLWHVPVLTLARHRSLGHIEPLVAASLALASLALAALSWKYVEKPFRDRRKVGRSQVFGVAAAGSALFLAVGLAGHQTDGFSFRLPPEQRRFLEHFDNSLPALSFHMRELTHRFRDDCNFYDLEAERRGNLTRKPMPGIAASCHTRDPGIANAVFLWGDSHAQQLHPGLREALPADWQVLQVASSGCVARIETSDHGDYCRHSNWFALKTIEATRPQVVIVAQAEGHDAAAMQAMGARLREAGAGKVIFMGPTPHWTTELPAVVVRRAWVDTPRRLLAGVDRRVLERDARLKARLQGNMEFEYFSIVDRMCDAQGCLVYLGDRVFEGLTAYDRSHLTPLASEWLARSALAAAVTRMERRKLSGRQGNS